MSRAVCFLLALAAAPCLAAEPPNLVRNPGFESLRPDGFAADWSGGEFGKPGGRLIVDRTAGHTGQNGLRLGVNRDTFNTCAATAIPIKPKTKYCVTWWCRTEGLRRARAYAFFQTNTGQRTFADMDQSGTQGWTQHFGEYTTAEDETWLHPVLTTQDLSGPECFAWFDDVGVYEGRFPPALDAIWQARQRAAKGVCETAIILRKTPEFTAWSDTLAAKVYREDGVPGYARPAGQIEFAAARGEEEFAQIVLTPTRDMRDVTAVPSDLVGPGRIPAASVRWWPVGYANVKTAHHQDTCLGLTPDPLLDPGPTAVAKGQNAPFLIGIRVPREARAGVYRGSVTLRSGATALCAIPVALRVYGFALPEDPVFRTLITFSPEPMYPGDKRPATEIERDICRVLHEHGIRGQGEATTADARIADGKVVADFTSFDARVEWVLQNLHFNAFFVGPMFGGGTSEGWEHHSKWLDMDPLSDDFNRCFPEYMRQVGQHLREKGWLDKAYVYLWDEPEKDYFDKVVALQKLALQGDPGLKIWETTSPSSEAFWGVVKAWSVPFGRPYFDEVTVAERRRAGDEIWVYNIPATLEAPPQLHRLWFWQAARYGAMGAQLWNVDFYHGIDPWQEITPKPYPVGREGKEFYYYDAGEAIMIYPNPRVGGLPLPCLRLKLLQKGLDDFGYLALLEQVTAAAARKRHARDPAAEGRARVVAMASEPVKEMGSYDLDTRRLAALRARIAVEIEGVQNGHRQEH